MVYEYYLKKSKHIKASRLAVRLFDHLYFRSDEEHSLFKKEMNLQSTLESLSKLIYKYGDDRERTRTILQHIYFLANHNFYYEARDLMLMSKLQESIHKADVSTQIIYNRALVQIGVSAFKQGLIGHAQKALSEIVGTQRLKELLAQHFSKYGGDKKIEKEERNRLMPLHLHLNLDMIEAVHLLSAMLLEVPLMLRVSFTDKKSLSRPFKRLLDFYDRQNYSGPPENTKDHINAGARSLMKGDWKGCYSVVSKLSFWNVLGEKVLNMLQEKIKVAALKTWLFGYSKSYNAIKLDNLSKMFDLEKKDIVKSVSKMILKENFYGLFDEDSTTILIQKVEPNKLEFGLLRMVEKTLQMNEHDSNLIDVKQDKYKRNPIQKQY